MARYVSKQPGFVVYLFFLRWSPFWCDMSDANYIFRMYDLDGNGELDLDEMTKIVEDIYTKHQAYFKLGASTMIPTMSAGRNSQGYFFKN